MRALERTRGPASWVATLLRRPRAAQEPMRPCPPSSRGGSCEIGLLSLQRAEAEVSNAASGKAQGQTVCTGGRRWAGTHRSAAPLPTINSLGALRPAAWSLTLYGYSTSVLVPSGAAMAWRHRRRFQAWYGSKYQAPLCIILMQQYRAVSELLEPFDYAR